MTKHRWVLYHTTLAEAALYAAEIAREERHEEYHRQRFFEVVARSLGADYEADRRLLDDPAPGGPVNRLSNWIALADLMGCPVPEAVREQASKGTEKAP